MPIVRFATICDYARCGKRSEEYREWPKCRVCNDHFCSEHQMPGSYREEDGKETCVCVICEEE